MVTFIILLSGIIAQEDTFRSSRVKCKSIFTWDMNKNSASKNFRRVSSHVIWEKKKFQGFNGSFEVKGF